MATQIAPIPAIDSPLRTSLRQSASPFNAVMSLIVVVLLAFDLLTARLFHADGLLQLLDSWPGLLLTLISLGLCHWFPLPRFIQSCENAIWVILLTNLLSALIQLAGRTSSRLVDAPLHAIDRALHIDTAAIALWAAHHPALQLPLAAAYDLVPLLIMAAVLLPPFLHRPAAARRYLLALVIATLLTAAIFALWPAIGPWVTEGFLPTAPQLRVTRYLTLLKSHRPLTLDFDAAAIVSFPSFHVVLALLSAVALSGLPRIRLVAWTLAILTCLSTLTTGWHYGIDLAGGCAIAWIAHRAAAALYPFLVPHPIAHTPASASALPQPRPALPN